MNTSSEQWTAADDTLLNQKFRNIDEEAGYLGCEKDLMNPETRNFVVDFTDSEARCATDLKTSEIRSLLKSPKFRAAETRWINFWGGDLEKKSIEAIVEHYGLSPRLVSLLCSKASDKYTNVRTELKARDHPESKSHSNPLDLIKSMKDAEKCSITDTSNSSQMTDRLPIDLQNANFGEIVDDIWHFCSVDWGQGYLFVGYNSLFSIPQIEVESGPDKPTGKRIWTSLVLCEDGTVVSVSEKAFPSTKVYPEILAVVRRNTLNVFRHLSWLSKTRGRQNDLMTINIRSFDVKPAENNKSSSLENASLLFYYLFDDWITSYSLAARKEHPYGIELENLRLEMFERADIRLLQSLHRIGRQIAVLKRIYESFELIIKRILERQRLLAREAGPGGNLGIHPSTSRPLHQDRMDSQVLETSADFAPFEPRMMSLGVRLSDSAVVRFERLSDRIRLYALSRLDEYLAEKESLVAMNFNLIALKDSQATEKLTRVTVLLSKIAAVFLPLSLMTAYFSTQIRDLQNVYTAKTYWLSFMVITVLSLAFIIFFGVASDTVEGRTIYKSLTRIAWTKAKRRKD